MEVSACDSAMPEELTRVIRKEVGGPGETQRTFRIWRGMAKVRAAGLHHSRQ